MKSKILYLFLFLMCLAISVNAKNKKKPAKKISKYEKIFKDKKYETYKGLVTIHKIDNEIYFEIQKDLFGKQMLLGSTVETTSDPFHGFAGVRTKFPFCVYFEQQDSVVNLKNISHRSTGGDEENINDAVSNILSGGTLYSFKILAETEDKKAVVFNATKYFLQENKYMDTFMGLSSIMSRTTHFKKDRCFVEDVKSFEDNFTITTNQSYEIDLYVFGFLAQDKRPYTAKINRSFMLLPEDPMKPRYSDPRVGVFSYKQTLFSDDEGSNEKYRAARWRLELKDEDAFKRGELVEPIKPIVFYVDDKFPEKWKPWIHDGIKVWNKAFEKIGFKNVIITKDYPKDDSDFNPGSLKYNCVKYVAIQDQNSMGPSWVDPRTGEIINASVYIYHGIGDLIRKWLVTQTSAVDKRVRSMDVPDEIMSESIKYVISHEIGHTLGFTHNMGASSTIPVDSLRSPTFTQKYGTTYSIMDYARYNYIAQPGDLERGVKLTPPDLGIYDYHAIEWLYKPVLEAKTAEEESLILAKWLSQAIKDPRLRFKKQQFGEKIDPLSKAEDLGDDHIKAAEYAFKNYDRLISHMHEWFKDEDMDQGFRHDLYFNIYVSLAPRMVLNIARNVGGIYLNEKHEGDPLKNFAPVPRDVQKKSVEYLLNIGNKLKWIDNKEFLKDLSSINCNGSLYANNWAFYGLLTGVRRLELCETRGFTDYTKEELIEDINNYLWNNTLKGETPSQYKLSLQWRFTSYLIANAGLIGNTFYSKENGINYITYGFNNDIQKIADLNEEISQYEEISGFNYINKVPANSFDTSHWHYEWLLKVKGKLEKCSKIHTGRAKSQYDYLLARINKALDNN